jgi:hypothetical protein
MILFVDQEEVRQKLLYDLKSLNIPVLNAANYLTPLSKLISKSWQAFTRKIINEKIKVFEQDKLTSEKEKFELEKKLFNIEQAGGADLAKKKERLNLRRVKIDKALSAGTFLHVFHKLKFMLAEGATTSQLRYALAKEISPNPVEIEAFFFETEEGNLGEFLGELIIQGIVKVIPPSNEYLGFNILTELGIKLAKDE